MGWRTSFDLFRYAKVLFKCARSSENFGDRDKLLSAQTYGPAEKEIQHRVSTKVGLALADEVAFGSLAPV